MDWQAISALGIVLGTLAVFAWRIAHPAKGKSACGKGCGCGAEKRRMP